jgi:tetratricopeptide (TPR) repeat protein
MRRILAAALLAGGLAAPPTGSTALRAEAPGEGAWLRVDTAHFTLISDSSEKRTREIGTELERFRAVLAAYHPGFKVDPPRPTSVFIFNRKAEFDPHRRYEGGKPTDHPGYFLGGADTNYISLLLAGSAGDASRMVYHEYVHEFLSYNLSSVPSWLEEGLAEFYSTFRADEHGAQIGLPIQNHVDLLATATLLPLPRLFEVDFFSPDYHETKRAGVFYAESWALVHYLFQGSTGRKPQVAAFLESLRRGASLEETFRNSFQTSPDHLMDELLRYLARRKFPFTIIEYKDLPVDVSARMSPMTVSEADARIEELQHELDVRGIGMNSQAMKTTPGPHGSEALREIALGRRSDLDGNIEGAYAHARKALELEPADPMVCYFAAYLLTRYPQLEATEATAGVGIEPRIAKVRDLLSRTLERRRDFFEAWFLLGETYMNTAEDPSRGIEAMQEALRLRPGSKEAAINLIELHLRGGDQAAARQVLDEFIVPMNDPALTESIRRAIASRTPTEADHQRTQEREIQESPDYASQIQAFNDAVEQANRGNLTDAAAMLEKILPGIRDPALAGKTREMLARLKQQIDRGKPGRH